MRINIESYLSIHHVCNIYEISNLIKKFIVSGVIIFVVVVVKEAQNLTFFQSHGIPDLELV